MAELSLEPAEYERTRATFRGMAARLALLREALVEHGFSDEIAVRFCAVWLDSALASDRDDEGL